MSSKVNWTALLIAVVLGAGLGVGIGLGAGFAARAMGWPTYFIGGLTGALVSLLVTLFYRRRTRSTSG